MSNYEVQVIGSGPNISTETQVDPYHFALRTSLRPFEHSNGGHYRFAARSGAEDPARPDVER